MARSAARAFLLNTLTTVSAFTALAMLASPLQAQANNAEAEEQLYEVNLVVFARRGENGEEAERWRKDVQLRYPEALIELRDPEAEAEEQAALLEQMKLNGTLPADFVMPTPAAEQTDSSENENGEDIAPVARYTISRDFDDPEFAKAAEQVEKVWAYRPLFAGRWQQQLDSRKDAPSILIQGGDAFDDYQELNGSIRLSRERYLHIHSDLWLSKFVSADQLHYFSEWPQLPQPFKRELAPEQESGAPAEQDNGVQQGMGADRSNTGFGAEQTNPGNGFNQAFQPRGAQQSFTQAPQTSAFNQAFGNAANSSSFDPLAEPGEKATYSALDQATLGGMAEQAQREHLIARTATLRQHRRMRSGELHYLDHPLFGVLIKINPVEADSDAAEKDTE